MLESPVTGAPGMGVQTEAVNAGMRGVRTQAGKLCGVREM